MDLRLLGPFEIEHGGRLLPMTRRRERCVLAILALNAGHAVSVERLAYLLWEGEPPDNSRAALHTYLSRMRSMLPGGTSVLRRQSGYTLEIPPHRVDALRFRALVASAHLAAGDDRRASLLRQALDLWRGQALADVASPWLRERLCADLVELRTVATEDWIAARLALGHHAELLPELAQLTAEHPTRERLAELQMTALDAAGRKADALTVYRRTRQLLIDRLGIEPGPALRRIHQTILREPPVRSAGIDDRRRTEAAAVGPAGSAGSVPRQLPLDVDRFTGRTAELAELDRLLATAGQGNPAVVISAVSGTAGVGKTALAVHWANRTTGAFPDGQLYVDLRGYDPDKPMEPGAALAGSLRALGVAGADIPQDVSERAAKYRTLLAGRRMLVLLDNARDSEQVRPLLPGTPSCFVVVTSRDSLAGLVARHGARRIELDLLTPAEAGDLLIALVGERARTAPAATSRLAEACARLPLALRIAAELAVSRPTAILEDLTEELTDQQRRLDLLEAGGDPRTAVRAVFSWSYRHLPDVEAKLFRTLGLHPGTDFDPHAAAALVDADLEQTRRMLGVLTRAQVIQRTGPGRYGMHDLLRAWAAERAHLDDSEPDRRAARTRLVDHYLHTACVAMDLAYPHEQHHRPHLALSRPVATIPLPDQAVARRWLETERANLLAVATQPVNHDRVGMAVALSSTLARHLLTGGHFPEALALHQLAVSTAGELGDGDGQARALNNLGSVYARVGLYEQASDHHRQALELVRDHGNQYVQARALNGLGVICWRVGRHEQAADYFERALALFRDLGDLKGEARALNNLGAMHGRFGRYEPAAEHHRQALALFRDVGDLVGKAEAMTNLGTVYERIGRYEPAAEHHRQALALFRDLHDPAGQAHALTNLATVYERIGRYEPAAEHHRQALALFRDLADPVGQAYVLTNLGTVYERIGRYEPAAEHHRQALALYRDLGDPAGQAEALNRLGHAYHDLGHPDEAREHWRQALTRYEELGLPDADEIRAHLEHRDVRYSD